MEAGQKKSTVGVRPERNGEPKPSDALPGGSPDGLNEAADAEPGKPAFANQSPEEAVDKEAGALDFLLGAPAAIKYDVPVTIDIPGGRQAELTFVIRQMDGKRIIELENEHRTGGMGPFSEIDDIAFNAHLVAEGTEKIVDKGSGREVTPDSMEWIGDQVTPQDAMRARFRFQSGVLAGIAGQIRAISGYRPDRVGTAERPMRHAVGNS